MAFFKFTSVFVVLCLFGIVLTKSASPRSLGRVHLPFLGLGPSCSPGCPQHYCDDDPAIIHGYCCGCAKFYDHLPVSCSPYVSCPVNTYSLCQEYEYMMHCCCS